MPTALSAEQARVLAKGPFPDYPFAPKAFVHANGLTQSYLDEGPPDGDVVVMLHGNPSWSYYWRHLVLGLLDPAPARPAEERSAPGKPTATRNFRCIVPDHIGMGLSDKPADDKYTFTLQSRIDDLDALLTQLDAGDNITLAVHDWGGMIGFGWALTHAARVKRLVILNTGAFPLPASKSMPWQLKLGRDSVLGAGLIRGFNAFAAGAARQGVETSMPAAVRRAYLAPYDSWANRVATLRFVQDIPLVPGDRAWALVEESGRRLHDYADRPTFIGWGLRDFVFDRHFLEGFTQVLPHAEVKAFEDAGHYVLEDKHVELVPAIRAFLDGSPGA